MWFGLITLATALIISVSAAYYSILGLTAIFASAFWPIVILGSSLEVGKVVSTLWLHKYWERAEMQYKVYLCAAVAILMVLTSMGVFGFLSKAHLDQAVPSGDIQAQVQIFDDKIQTQKDNIKTARAALTQMDMAVDQVMGRSQDEKGADKAVAIRRSQARERNNLQNDISKAQTEITKLQEQRAPVASQARQVEAEVGPIKYIAALIYGDNPEANTLEKAVRWVIILIVIVFDPLALTLLLAATKSIEWERGIINNKALKRPEPEYEPDDGPLTDEQIAQIKEMVKDDLSTGPILSKQSLFQDPDIPDQEPIKQPSVLAGLDSMWSSAKQLVVKDTEADHAPLNFEQTEIETEQERKDKTIIRAWKEQNPNDTIKHQERLLQSGFIDQLPWQDPGFQSSVLAQMKLEADNVLPNATGQMRGFGTAFPPNAIKGDMFLRVDQLPSVLYKFNGNNWIEVDKSLSDQHAYDEAYIDHLIEKISTGEYDSELLSNAERSSIEQRLSKTPGTV